MVPVGDPLLPPPHGAPGCSVQVHSQRWSGQRAEQRGLPKGVEAVATWAAFTGKLPCVCLESLAPLPRAPSMLTLGGWVGVGTTTKSQRETSGGTKNHRWNGCDETRRPEAPEGTSGLGPLGGARRSGRMRRHRGAARSQERTSFARETGEPLVALRSVCARVRCARRYIRLYISVLLSPRALATDAGGRYGGRQGSPALPNRRVGSFVCRVRMSKPTPLGLRLDPSRTPQKRPVANQCIAGSRCPSSAETPGQAA